MNILETIRKLSEITWISVLGWVVGTVQSAITVWGWVYVQSPITDNVLIVLLASAILLGSAWVALSAINQPSGE